MFLAHHQWAIPGEAIMHEITDIAVTLATELGKDRYQMCALVSGYTSTLRERSSLYRPHVDRLTDAGARVVADHIRHLNASGTLDWHLAQTQAADRADA